MDVVTHLRHVMGERFQRILIVDDDLSLVPLWNIVVGRHSKLTRIEWAVSSEEAQRLIRDSIDEKQQYDLIVADLFLAGSDTGFEFLNSIAVRGLNAKTILVSAAEQSSLEMHCRKTLPNTRVIAKPLNVVTCERILAELRAGQEGL